MVSRPVLWRYIIFLLAATWAGVWAGEHWRGHGSVLEQMENALLDIKLRAAGPLPAPQNIVIVAIDDRTLEVAAAWPLERTQLADLLQAIHRAGAGAVGLDLLLIDPTSASDDRALAEALGLLPSLTAASAEFADRSTAAAIPRTATRLDPLPIFADQAQVGLVNISPDRAGNPRFMPLLIHSGQGLEPGFAYQAAQLLAPEPLQLTTHTVQSGHRLVPLELGYHLPLRPYGPTGTIATISALDILRGGPHPDLSGKLVVIGATATGAGDRFQSAFDSQLPGVELLATGIANLLAGPALIRTQQVRGIDAGVAVGLTLFGVACLFFLPVLAASLCIFGAIVCWLGVSSYMITSGYWFSAVLPIVAVVPPAAVAWLIKQWQERRQAMLAADAVQRLGQFHDPALAEMIASDPQFLAHPESRSVSIVFIDLCGFTGFSEQAGPETTQKLLRAFHQRTGSLAAAHGGTVLNYMGDGVMIGFGVLDQSTEAAAGGAIAFGFAAKEILPADLAALGFASSPQSVKIGGHCGDAVLSRLGYDQQQQIAVTGDCVNVAARLMDLCGKSAATMVLSEALLTAAKLDDPADVDQRKSVKVRGRHERVAIAVWRS